MPERRAIVLWAFGALCIFLGAVIAGSVEPSVIGATTFSVIVAYVIAFIFILLGGMFWISSSLVTK